MKVEFISQFI